jgi:hypothetical protein
MLNAFLLVAGFPPRYNFCPSCACDPSYYRHLSKPRALSEKPSFQQFFPTSNSRCPARTARVTSLSLPCLDGLDDNPGFSLQNKWFLLLATMPIMWHYTSTCCANLLL